MKLHTIKNLFAKSEKTDWALPHFNTHNAELVRAVIKAAEAEKAPVIIAVGPSSISHLGSLAALSELIKVMVKESSASVALHLDHAKDINLVKAALDCGFSSVMFDGSSLEYAENVRLTSEVVKMAHDKGADAEGEIGMVPHGADAIGKTPLTDIEQALEFAEKTKVDLLAVSVGSSHSMRSQDATLDVELIKKIYTAGKVPLVLHGGSGVVDADIKRAIPCGLRKININTALKMAFVNGIEKELAKDKTIDMLPLFQSGMNSAEAYAIDRIKLCNASNRA
ncbi:class II fructose-bisphosphate aldolase [Desulfovibrio litoralis]|uniref:Fructose-bisphosphate aldolase, class II n=1 Tax=Desulfovibrio litoralis DSM 11393 TaxID=1121455 RepID=A0A1M7TBY6_9BACT|nr:class II fructose-bisphosphate aldolase [Desulfovibrio litoralis]SHN68178.1 fructose-bisphosphate aldolase, class II [Desulfovibrio litoralis DSM 11393]